MKNSVKKIFLVLCASSIMLASATAFAAPTSGPSKKTDTISANDTVNTTQTDSEDTDESSSSDADLTESDTDELENNTTAGAAASGVTQNADRPVPTAISVGQEQANTVQSTEAQKATNKKYASKGSIAVWFILSILINAVLSFMIGNRFYKLAKKESHITPELRALRRDLEEKFADSVGGFNEMETDVVNSNDNYSMNGSIKMPERKSTDFAADSEDVFKKWEERMQQRRAPKPVVDEEDIIEDEEQPVRKYRPTREKVQTDDEDEYDDVSEDYEDEEPSRFDAAKKKAKGILGDLFPFKED